MTMCALSVEMQIVRNSCTKKYFLELFSHRIEHEYHNGKYQFETLQKLECKIKYFLAKGIYRVEMEVFIGKKYVIRGTDPICIYEV